MKSSGFSVLMSVYAKENPVFFDEALKSVFEQTTKPSEVIIVEDGPLTDKLYGIIEKYKTTHKNIIKIYKKQSNQGLGLALRDGLLECKNKIVFRMDTDDVCVKHRFEKQLKILRDNEIDVVGSNIDEYDKDMRNKTGAREVPETDAEIKKRIKTRNPMNHMTVAYRKESVLKAGNYEEMTYFEDYYLWAKMAKNGFRFYNIQEPLVKVRGGKEMIGRRGGKSYIKHMVCFENKLLKMKMINQTTYLKNILIRTICALMPNTIRSLIYKIILRKKYTKVEASNNYNGELANE